VKLPKNGNYDVGYCKPPTRTRFQPGQSGNLKGRPKKKAQTLGEILADVLNEKLTITEFGQSKTITKKHALQKVLVNKALGGHLPSIKLLLDSIEIHAGVVEPKGENGAADSNGTVVVLLPHNGRDPVDWDAQQQTLDRLLKARENRQEK
jgi:hypothetical protein